MPVSRAVSYFLFAVAGLAVPATGTLAQAEGGPYAGAGLSFAPADTDVTAVAGGEGDLTGLSFALGRKWIRGNYSYAIELGGDLTPDGACGTGATGPYMCDPDATLRLRGLAGRPLGDAELFGAVGVGAAFGTLAAGEAASGSGTVYGLSLGAGMSYPLRDGVNIRGEVNYDNFRNASQPPGQEPDRDALSIRLMGVFNF